MNSSQSPAKVQPIDPHPTPGFMAKVEGECVGDAQLDCPRILPTWCAAYADWNRQRVRAEWPEGSSEWMVSLVVIREEKATLRRHQEEAEEVIDPIVASALQRLIGHTWHRLQTAQQCRRLALAAAEALPDDPEAPNVE